MGRIIYKPCSVRSVVHEEAEPRVAENLPRPGTHHIQTLFSSFSCSLRSGTTGSIEVWHIPGNCKPCLGTHHIQTLFSSFRCSLRNGTTRSGESTAVNQARKWPFLVRNPYREGSPGPGTGNGRIWPGRRPGPEMAVSSKKPVLRRQPRARDGKWQDLAGEAPRPGNGRF